MCWPAASLDLYVCCIASAVEAVWLDGVHTWLLHMIDSSRDSYGTLWVFLEHHRAQRLDTSADHPNLKLIIGTLYTIYHCSVVADKNNNYYRLSTGYVGILGFLLRTDFVACTFGHVSFWTSVLYLVTCSRTPQVQGPEWSKLIHGRNNYFNNNGENDGPCLIPSDSPQSTCVG
jgi:hypothetical protein